MSQKVYKYIALTLTLGAVCGAGFYTHQTIASLESALATTAAERDVLFVSEASSTVLLAVASSTIATLSSELNLTAEELSDIESDYEREKRKNDDFEDEYRETITTIKNLDKLSKTDEELLQKYSKISFLNEHYVPEGLSEIPSEWKYSETKPNQLHSKVLPYLEDMLEAAEDDGVDIWVVSAYRSFDTQAQLKGAYTITYGAGANAFSADQGFSEHQLGTTVDFTSTGLSGGLDGFSDTEAYKWLVDNGARYGFTLSYPEDNQFYIFEPWHWRFVGTELARDLDRANDTFYDLDQREINEYLLNIFD